MQCVSVSAIQYVWYPNRIGYFIFHQYCLCGLCVADCCVACVAICVSGCFSSWLCVCGSACVWPCVCVSMAVSLTLNVAMAMAGLLALYGSSVMKSWRKLWPMQPASGNAAASGWKPAAAINGYGVASQLAQLKAGLSSFSSGWRLLAESLSPQLAAGVAGPAMAAQQLIHLNEI